MNQQSVNTTNRAAHSAAHNLGNKRILVIPAKAAQTQMSNQGVATLVVMCCVLTIILMFCCLAAPGIRDLCKRYVFRKCVIDDPEVNNVWTRREALETQLKIVAEKQQRRPSRHSDHRQSRRHSSHQRPL